MEPNSNDNKKNTRPIRMMGFGIAIGAGIGVAIGAATDNMGTGIALGIAIGFVFGAGMGLRRKNSDSSETPVE